MELKTSPAAEAGMLIRRPVADVFEAVVDPAITSNFWFSKGSDRLDAGKPVTWTWEMYGISSRVEVTEIEPHRSIALIWDPGTDHASHVAWRFRERPDGFTFVEVKNFSFAGDADAQMSTAIGSTEGFALVLAGLKAWLEQGVRINVVHDRHPGMWVKA